MLHMLIHFLGISVAVYLVALILPGMRLNGFKSALSVAAVYGLVNWALKLIVFKLFIFVSLPLLLLSFGLFLVVVNTIALRITDRILDDFELSGWGTAFLASIGISASSILLTAIL